MAQLNSPGVSVQVIDESFYTTAAPGTVPLIVVATEENRKNSAGTQVAPGTTKADYGNVRLLTSQKDLGDIFGNPVFKTDAYNNPIHAGEQNEYGLQAAYSYLGVSSLAYVIRADLDLAQLDPEIHAPVSSPADGSYWFDISSTKWGVFAWDAHQDGIGAGQTFTKVPVLVITERTKVVDFAGEDYTPKTSIGKNGEYAIVAVSSLIKLWYKKPKTNTPAGTWVEVGTQEWAESIPAIVGTALESTVALLDTDIITINSINFGGASIATLAELRDAINVAAIGVGAEIINNKLELYSSNDIVIASAAGSTASKVGITVGVYRAPVLSIADHRSRPKYKLTDAENAYSINGRPTGSLWIQTTTPNSGADFIVKQFSSANEAWVTKRANLYPNNQTAIYDLDKTGGGLNIEANSVYVKYNDSEDAATTFADFKIYRRRNGTSTTVVSAPVNITTFTPDTYQFQIEESVIGSDVLKTHDTVSFTVGLGDTAETVVEAIKSAIASTLIDTNIVVGAVGTTQFSLTHALGGDIKFIDLGAAGVGFPVSKLFNIASENFYAHPDGIANHYLGSLWTSLTEDKSASFIVPSLDGPTSETADGRLWYNVVMDEVDLLIHNGETWVGLHYAGDVNPAKAPSPLYTTTESLKTDPKGPIISATKPTAQTDGTPLVPGDLWIDTSDMENYPRIYRFINATMKWRQLDTSDQTTENGVLFHDARWATDGQSKDPSAIADLLVSDFLDFDAPDPALYPEGMLLWNLRRSGNNVKQYSKNYVNHLERNTRFYNELMGIEGSEYYPHKWVSVAANQEDGTGAFGRKAQRAVVIQALQEVVNSNQQIRDEERRAFNLIACPGYPELITELVNLNYDRGITAFVVGDTPARLTPDASELVRWGTNEKLALYDGDKGLVTANPYLGVFYPWGYSSDNIGNNIAVPPSHMMLRTFALSDKDSYPWFAPAGTTRGIITNASNVGYITKEGEFQAIELNNGMRDVLASIKVNSLTYMVNSGLVNYAQYTRSNVASALDRINVARLIVYLRRRLELLARPYLFEPNDDITRNQIKRDAEMLLTGLIGQRALYDFAVICDKSNNTPDRIDRNELYLDIAIEPVKSVEFIYIPLRIKNTGEIAALGAK